MTIPQLDDDYYFHLSVTERVHSPHEIYLKIHEQTTKPDDWHVSSTKVADYSPETMDADPTALIEEAINRMYYNTPQYFKGFEDPEHKFNRALSNIINHQHQEDATIARLLYPDFLDPEKMDDVTLYGLVIVLYNYCEILPNTIKNIRPSLTNAQTIAVLAILERLSVADRPAPEMDDLFEALPIVLESARSGEYYDLPNGQWEAVEYYYALLAKKVGLVARNADGQLIVLPEYEDIHD